MAHAMPVSTVPDSEMGWCPGMGLTTLHPSLPETPREAWDLGEALQGSGHPCAVTPGLALSQVLQQSDAHVRASEAWQECGAGLVTRGCAMTSAQGWQLPMEEELLSSSVPAARWGEAPREATPTCYQHPANCCCPIIPIISPAKGPASSALHCHHFGPCPSVEPILQSGNSG